MDINITVRERNHLSGVANAVRRSPDDLLDIVLDDLVDTIRHSMEGAGGGRLYMRHGVPHQASAPGQPPAIEPPGFSPTAGQLFASISKEHTSRTSGRVYTRVDYAKYLEYGTSKMKPRPFMRPGARKVRGTGAARHLSIVIHRAAAL